MIQTDVIFDSSNLTPYIFCTVENRDSWEDYLNQDNNFSIYTPPKTFENAAIVQLENNKKWVIIYNHDIPFDPILIKGEVTYSGLVSNYYGIIMVKDIQHLTNFKANILKNGDIIRVLAFLITLLWICLVYVSYFEIKNKI